MLPDILTSRGSRHWVYILIKTVMILAFSLLILSRYPRTVTDFASVADVAYPAIIGFISIVIIGLASLIKSIKIYIPFMALVADWALVFTYMLMLPMPSDNNFLLPMGITIVVAISGIMYLGAIFGMMEVLGTLLAALAGSLLRNDRAINAVLDNPQPVIPVLFFVILILVMTLIWHATIDEENTSGRKRVREEIETSRKRLTDMQGRTRALAEMAARINASLQYDRILDASLDLGRLSVRDNSSARIVTMALMVTTDDGELTIEAHRGLNHNQVHHVFPGRSGIIAEAMDRGEPIIFNGGNNDPELKVITSFAHVKSTLVIPLRANFETYGVLVFASTARNAINEDHIDTLATIGVQATIALQNALLYHNLQEEKERILRLEENGRKSLVRDLHDIPTQTVSAVAMHLSTIPKLMSKRGPERVEDEIKNIRSMALRAAEELRHVMFTIRPLSLEADGLKTALRQLADKMDNTYKQPMQIQFDDRIEGVLDKDAKGSLFYLIEEAANNARKYAEATLVQVQGTIQNKHVIIRVRDNGKGFDLEKVGTNYENRGSFGMVNMRERAELINGEFHVQSAPGKGTVVTVRVPIKGDEDKRRVPILKPRRPTRKQYSGPISPAS